MSHSQLILEPGLVFVGLDQELFPDVTLRVCRDGRYPGSVDIPAHRVLLASCSHYFKSLFCSGMKETGSMLVRLKDKHPETVSAMIRLLYQNKMDIASDQELINMLEVASKYQVVAVQEACVDRLVDRLDCDNLADIYMVADQLGLSGLCQSCVVLAEALMGVEDTDLARIPKGLFLDVLQLQHRFIPEYDMCHLAITWVVRQGMQQDKRSCKDIFKHLKFDHMEELQQKALWGHLQRVAGLDPGVLPGVVKKYLGQCYAERVTSPCRSEVTVTSRRRAPCLFLDSPQKVHLKYTREVLCQPSTVSDFIRIGCACWYLELLPRCNATVHARLSHAGNRSYLPEVSLSLVRGTKSHELEPGDTPPTRVAYEVNWPINRSLLHKYLDDQGTLTLQVAFTSELKRMRSEGETIIMMDSDYDSSSVDEDEESSIDEDEESSTSDENENEDDEDEDDDDSSEEDEDSGSMDEG